VKPAERSGHAFWGCLSPDRILYAALRKMSFKLEVVTSHESQPKQKLETLSAISNRSL